MLITRKVEFSASHLCYHPALSEERNRAIYGAAANKHGHGHNYTLEVSLDGSPDPVTGMVFDLKALNSATNLTWKVADASQDNACVVQADNGNTVSMVVTPTAGQTSAVLDAGKSACDSGTSTDTSVGDGGFVCKVSGINTTGALFGGSQKFVVISAVTFNGASDDDVQQAIVALLKSFQAS